MILEKVIAGSGVTAIEGNPSVEIGSICNDSRKVTEGSLFVAVRGFASDGHSYIATAIRMGAAAIVCEDMEMARLQAAETERQDITLVHVES